MWFSAVCTLIYNEYASSQWSKCCGTMRRSRVSPQQILTAVMTRIVVDKSTDNAKPHSICFSPQYQRQRKCFLFLFFFFFQGASWTRHCVTHWREQRCLDSCRQRQISQSDREISSNCDKNTSNNLSTARREMAMYKLVISKSWVLRKVECYPPDKSLSSSGWRGLFCEDVSTG